MVKSSSRISLYEFSACIAYIYIDRAMSDGGWGEEAGGARDGVFVKDATAIPSSHPIDPSHPIPD